MLKKINSEIFNNNNNNNLINSLSNEYMYFENVLYKMLKNNLKQINPKKSEELDEIYTKNSEINEIINSKPNDEIKVYLLTNWCSSDFLCNLWNKMSKGNYKWNNIKIVSYYPADYILIVNGLSENSSLLKDINFNLSKLLIYQMEPNIKNNINWGEWSDLSSIEDKLKHVGYHENYMNNIEWHLSKTYKQLKNETIIKDPSLKYTISAIVSNKYTDFGQKKRINFLQYLDCKDDIELHVFGSNDFKWKNYKGTLPKWEKDNGLFPYYYTFNAENCKKHNYVTEKLVDGILAECLTFYWGCPNADKLFHDKSFYQLDLHDFEKDYNTIKSCLKNFEWENRINYIKQEKQLILDEKQFFPNLEKILNK